MFIPALKKITTALAIIIALPSQSIIAAESTALPAIVPHPVDISASAGAAFVVKEQTRIHFDTRDAGRAIERSLEPFAKVLAEEILYLTGQQPAVLKLEASLKKGPSDIVLRFQDLEKKFAKNEAEEDQSYQLKVTDQQIIVQGQYTKGISYGTASLIQTLRENSGSFEFPAMVIMDKPATEYRGVMIDLARKPHSIGVIKDTIRLSRLVKIRYIQLHLTDHQSFTFPFPPVTDHVKNNWGYTMEEMKDLVSYADARGVTLVPELDLPGHSAKLREAGFLDPNENDADVASEANFGKINQIIDAMLEVFTNTPYFHIGGDESAAGNNLVPFLTSVNKHLRGNPPGGKRRMLVWEGFHGAPVDQLPPKGDDRVIVLSWESSYNSPWDLLEAGYEVINSSWAPTYILASFGGPLHCGIPTSKKWSPSTLYTWDKNTFMHWEAGRAVFDDKGPNDPDRSDHRWNSDLIGKSDQVIGGQMQFWEQMENAVIENLIPRLPVVAERLWNPEVANGFESYQKRIPQALKRILPIVQPIAISPERPENYAESPIYDVFQPYSGDQMELSFQNRSKIEGVIRYELVDGMRGGYTSFDFSKPKSVTTDSPAYEKALTKKGGFSVRAQLFSKDGKPIDGTTWGFFNDWQQRLKVTEYDLSGIKAEGAPDLLALAEERVLSRYQTPFLRGPLHDIRAIGHMQISNFVPPKDGKYTLEMEVTKGTVSLYLDLNQNGKWEENEKILVDINESKKGLEIPIELKADQAYALRVDQKSDTRHPLCQVTILLPGAERAQDITDFLVLPN